MLMSHSKTIFVVHSIICRSFRTDFIFHAIEPSTGEIVEFDVFIARLNVDEFFRILAACNPISITVRYYCYMLTY